MVAEHEALSALQAARDRKSQLSSPSWWPVDPPRLATLPIAASTILVSPYSTWTCLADGDITRLVSEKLLAKHRVLPMFRRGKRLFLVFSDPTDQHAIDEIKFQTGLSVEAVIVEDDKLQKAVDKAIENVEAQTNALSVDDDGVDLEGLEVSGGDDLEGESVSRDDVEDAPIVRFVNKLMLDAIRRGASDIHFEPFETDRVRYRVDGALYEIAPPPKNLALPVISRIKVMSRPEHRRAPAAAGRPHRLAP